MRSLIPDWTQLRAAAELQYDLGGKWKVDDSIVEGSLTVGLTETYCKGLLRPSSIIVKVGLVTSLSLSGSCRTENNVLCNVCQWFFSRERRSTPELGKLGVIEASGESRTKSMLLWPHLFSKRVAEIRMNINKAEQIRLGPGQPDRSVRYQGRAKEGLRAVLP